MSNIDKSIEQKANDVVNHFLALGATVAKTDYDYVVKNLTAVKDELIEELRNN